MARILLISHEPEAAPAVIGEVLAARGLDVVVHTVLSTPGVPDVNYPDPRGFDAVVAFGSFANAYDESARVWVAPEVELLQMIVSEDVPYLGVCFGGQLLAESLGGGVERAPAAEQEIGLVAFEDLPRHGLPAGPWFTWHEDRIVLPEDIEVLSRNANAIQLFRHGRAVGTQFHPEVDASLVGSWLSIGGDHVPDHTTPADVLGAVESNTEALRANCEHLMEWFLSDIAMIGP